MSAARNSNRKKGVELKKIVLLLLLVSSLACGLLENVTPVASIPNKPPSSSLSALKKVENSTLRTKASTSPTFCEVSTGVENGGLLNLREGPGVNYTPVRVLHEGEVIVLANIPAQYGWQSVKADFIQGWVNATYIKCTLTTGTSTSEVKP